MSDQLGRRCHTSHHSWRPLSFHFVFLHFFICVFVFSYFWQTILHHIPPSVSVSIFPEFSTVRAKNQIDIVIMRTIFVHIFILPCIYSALAQALTSGVENVGLEEKRIKAFDAPATAALLVVLLLLLLLLQQHPFPAGPISIVIISTIYSPNWQGCEH